MKKYIALFIIALVPGAILAQSTPFSKLYDTYVSEQGFETTEMRPGSTSFEWEKNIESQQILEMIKDIESVRILEYKGEGKLSPEKLWKKMSSAAADGDYVEVVSFQDDQDIATLYMLKESNGVYREIALLVKDEDQVTLVAITGDIDFKEIFSPETMKSIRELGDYYRKDKGECGVK